VQHAVVIDEQRLPFLQQNLVPVFRCSGFLISASKARSASLRGSMHSQGA